MSEVGVIGAGYVGLTTAACLARLGHSVVCADLDDERVRALSKGEVPILEEGLPALVAGAVVVNKSTMPVGSTRFVARHLSQAGASSDVGVASNPEFLREGTAV